MGKHTDKYGRNGSDLGAIFGGIAEGSGEVGFEDNPLAKDVAPELDEYGNPMEGSGRKGDSRLPSRTAKSAKGGGLSGKRNATEFNLQQEADALGVQRRGDSQVDVAKRLDPIQAAAQLRQANMQFNIAHGLPPGQVLAPDQQEALTQAFAAKTGADTEVNKTLSANTQIDRAKYPRIAEAEVTGAENTARNKEYMTLGNGNVWSPKTGYGATGGRRQLTTKDIMTRMPGMSWDTPTGGKETTETDLPPETFSLPTQPMVQDKRAEVRGRLGSSQMVANMPANPYIGGKSADDWLGAGIGRTAPTMPPSAAPITNTPVKVPTSNSGAPIDRFIQWLQSVTN